MTSLIERELSRTQFKSMVVMVQHVVDKVCKDEAVQISGRNKYDTMFWCMVLCERLSPPCEKGQRGLKIKKIELHIYPWSSQLEPVSTLLELFNLVKNDSSIILALAWGALTLPPSSSIYYDDGCHSVTFTSTPLRSPIKLVHEFRTCARDFNWSVRVELERG